MSLSATVFHYRRHYLKNLVVTAPLSFGVVTLGAAGLFVGAALTGGISFSASTSALVGGDGALGGRYVLIVTVLGYAAVIFIGAPIARIFLIWTKIIADTNAHLYKLRALRRTLFAAYTAVFVIGSFAIYIAHTGLVGLTWYDAAWQWTSSFVFSWGKYLPLIAVAASFALKYLRPADDSAQFPVFEAWTYGQVNLDVGAFGTESLEAASRLREYARARRDKAHSSSAMRRYLLDGDSSEFSLIFRTRHRVSRTRRALERAVRRYGADSWHGLTKLRERVTRLVGAPNEPLALTSSTSSAIRLFLDMTPRAQVILTTDMEHPVVIHLLRELYGHRCRVRIVKVVDAVVQGEWDKVYGAVEAECRANSVAEAVWVFSHVDYVSGAVLPLTELVTRVRREMRKVHVLVDGAHGPGNVEVRVREYGIDGYAFCGHKWLMGTPGSGFLWVGPRLSERFRKVDFEGPSNEERQKGAEGRRSSLAMEPFITCDAYVSLLNNIGARSMLKHQKQLRDHLTTLLEEIDGIDVVNPKRASSSIVAFKSSQQAALRIADVVTSCETAHVLGGYFDERQSARFCVPYFLEADNVRNIAVVVGEAVRRVSGGGYQDSVARPHVASGQGRRRGKRSHASRG